MSFQVSAACKYLKMRGVAKNILMQLAEMADEEGCAWPSIDYLQKRTDWSRSAVIDALNYLQAEKVIRRDKRNGRHTIYWITPNNWNGDRHKFRESNRSTIRTGAKASQVVNVDLASPQSGHDPSTTRTLIPVNTNEYNTPQPPSGEEWGFDEFFSSYPKQVSIEKARNEWRRLAPDVSLRAVIRASVLEWRDTDQWKRCGGRFIPMPHTWLRNGGWRNIAGISPLPTIPVPTVGPVSLPAKMPASVIELAARMIGSNAKSQTVRAAASQANQAKS